MADDKNRAQTGQKGEAIAAKFYLDDGYQLLAHNYKTRMGELDLVLRKGDTVVICEVKTRGIQAKAKATPAAAVHYHKQQRLIAATKRYLQLTHQSDAHVRFDVVEVMPFSDGKWQVNRMQGAFTES
ncbi:MAG: YraN family protein [Faecalibacterium sp.]